PGEKRTRAKADDRGPNRASAASAGPKEVQKRSEAMRRVLVAGIGNVFQGDDGFGVEVAQRLLEEQLPDGVEVVDVGIRGLHLAYRLLDNYDVLIAVDAVFRGGPPGTVYVLEPDLTQKDAECPDAHTIHLDRVLAMVQSLGGRPP